MGLKSPAVPFTNTYRSEKENMKNNQKNQQTHQDKPQEKNKKNFSVRIPSITPKNILSWSKGRAFRIITAVIAVLVFAGCINEAFDYTEATMSNEAYKYSEETYENIELAVQNYLGDDGPDIVALQENVPEFITRYTTSYENDETVLVCTKENGLFTAVTTSVITKDFTLKGSHIRNFNSFEEYKNFFWNTFKVEVAKRALGTFLMILVIWLVSTSIILGILKKVVKIQEEKTKNKAKPIEDGIATVENSPSGVPAS